MALPKRIVIVTLLLASTTESRRSGVRVENGIYSGITVKVEEAVPKHLCHRTLEKLEVRSIRTFQMVRPSSCQSH